MPRPGTRTSEPSPHTVIRTDRSTLTFYQADCLDVFRALPDASLSVIVTSPPYNLGVEYRPSPRWKVFVQLNNALDQRYSTGAQLGANAFDAAGNYSARALPRNAQGDYPVARSAFYAPGAPRSGWLGVRRSFD